MCVSDVRAWDLPPREDVGSGSAPPARPYIPFEGRTTTQDSYVPKMLSDDGPTFGSRSGTGDGAPPARPYVPFEGRSTAQDAYAPKVLSDDGPTFGSRSVGSGGPGQRPYVPFEGQSETQASFPYVGRCVALLRVVLCCVVLCCVTLKR